MIRFDLEYFRVDERISSGGKPLFVIQEKCFWFLWCDKTYWFHSQQLDCSSDLDEAIADCVRYNHKRKYNY